MSKTFSARSDFCMMPRDYFTHTDAVKNKYFFLTEHMGGARRIATVNHETIKIFDHHGAEVQNGLYYVWHTLRDYLYDLQPFVLDGEFCDGVYRVFDILDQDAFDGHCCDTYYYLRRQRLEAYIDHLPVASCVRAAPVLYAGTDITQIGKEWQMRPHGIRIHLSEEFYQFGPTNAMLEARKE